ncbi:cation-translocating P-type ATPase [Verrucomicrobia bacterium]|jgi:Cd2+/Zn2+-exporting ATPase|nr:cation-translocating P-type ATPase [Verrucomicrobiota bacterium]MDB4690139.1 cation-translocating P-type ATPase [Verrucomicrobiota bacterium]
MQITSLLSQKQGDHQHDDHCDGCGHDHEHTEIRLNQILVGLLFVINSFIIHYFFENGKVVGDVNAMIGAALLGYPIVWTAIKDLRKGRLSTNELVALAVLASFASGEYQESGLVAFFMLLGEIIETRTAEGARASIESLVKLTPTKARRINGSKEDEVEVKDLKVGDVIRIRPGDNIAADGVIMMGEGSINQANITGESLPVDKSTGDDVFAGTQNLNGVLEVKVSRADADTTLGRVHDLILAAEKTKLPIMRIVDQYMGFYTPLVLLVGALVWAFTQDLSRVITVFIIACPCAFILATPTAMVAALSSAARLGILIKNVADIELSAKINAFIFDKTGTLTTGKLAVSRLAPQDGIKPAELLHLAASAEKYSNHPTAKALAQLANEAGLDLTEPQNFKETAGKGITAKVGEESLIVGRANWLKDNGLTDDFMQNVDLSEAEGYSLLYVARNGSFIGWIGLQDQTRPEAQEALSELLGADIRRIAMVSGDREPVAARVAREIGCEEVVAECLPQNKVEYVHKMKAKGYRVAVVGDGVNDAPALAAGDLGIAMGAAGSEVAIHSATIALMNNDLRRLPFLVKLSRQTRTVINQNFMFGVVFVIGGFVMASLAYINPIIAAMLHVVGSLLVVFNSFRLVRQGEELEPFLAEEKEAAPESESEAPKPSTQPA